MKSKKTFGLLMLLAIVALGLVGSANAATGCTFDGPTSSSIIKGSTVLFNVTCDEFTAATNCTISTASSSASGDSFTAFNLNATPGLIGNQSLNATVSTSSREDASDWTFDGTCQNVTGFVTNITAITSVTIDNTDPTTPTALTPLNGEVDKDGSVTFSATVTGTQTTACWLNFTSQANPGSVAYAMTHSGNTCSHSLTNVAAADYGWFIVATDGLNSSASDSVGLVEKFQQSTGPAKTVKSAKTTTKGTSTTQLIVVGLLAAFAFNIGGLRTKLTKGGKKK